ncbi:RNA polymerase sigma factor [Kordiimonas sp. SCSIO 12610]|uniref:RNA polymerase sigma factor n=1 Tax=Kordiimonas sp. SCSIO 12610 TaxID=2829597 RepID=UPI0021090506|nr:sigma-70 family RNA polymerase sigma factor [Kordiimonas sp. SCSIO 12610]UTW56583.1 sigma-70 family RNA polymerase sigma factor [Kordiimonas sp. SCSIO 12610]
MALTDQHLIAHYLNGEEAAINLLIKRYQQQVRSTLAHLTKGDMVLVDDLAQETFMTAYRKLNQFEGKGHLGGWLMTIAYRCFINHCRKHGTKELLSGDAFETEVMDNMSSTAHSHLTLDIAKAMQCLSHEERFAIDLCFTQGYSHSEAARIMEMPLGTCKSHINRGKAKLKKHLKGRSDAY